MNLIDFMSRNVFLKQLFPNGIEKNNVMIGKFTLDFSNCAIDFHVRQKPSIEVKKYGVWGENYNTIVIQTLGVIGGRVHIENWEDRKFEELSLVKQDDENYVLTSSKGKFRFNVELQGLIFQNISVYINYPDDE